MRFISFINPDFLIDYKPPELTNIKRCYRKLGYDPVWAIPVTDFKNTLINAFLALPNSPLLCVVFETDDYVKINRIKWYSEVKKDTKEMDITNCFASDIDSLDDCEIILNPLNLFKCIYKVFPVVNFQHYSDFPFVSSAEKSFAESLCYIYQEYKGFVHLESYYMPEQQGFSSDPAHIDYVMFTRKEYLRFLYTVFPVILYISIHLGKSSSDTLDVPLYLCESIVRNFRQMSMVMLEYTQWDLKTNRDYKKYKEFRNKMLSLIQDDEKILKRNFFSYYLKIKPNESCPCGSGKKFKKCCGKID